MLSYSGVAGVVQLFAAADTSFSSFMHGGGIAAVARFTCEKFPDSSSAMYPTSLSPSRYEGGIAGSAHSIFGVKTSQSCVKS